MHISCVHVKNGAKNCTICSQWPCGFQIEKHVHSDVIKHSKTIGSDEHKTYNTNTWMQNLWKYVGNSSP